MSVSQTDIAFENKKIRWVTIGFVVLSIYRSISVAAGQFIYNGYHLPNEDWAYLAGTLILWSCCCSTRRPQLQHS
jgi:hypothetical protein